jgi:hypothetical protein
MLAPLVALVIGAAAAARTHVALVVSVTGVLVALSGLAASPAAASVLIGSDLSATPPAKPSLGDFHAQITAVQTAAPASGVAAGGMTAPSDGVVVRWSMKTGFTEPATTLVRLRIVRPGLSVTAAGAGTGAWQTVPLGQASFEERLPIKAGDGIGLDADLGVFAYLPVADPVGMVSAWAPTNQLGDGQPATAAFSTGPGALFLQAEIEPDADADGFGDESQDPDDDNDGMPDTGDNCPAQANPDQLNADQDPAGDACDADDDNDGLTDAAEGALGTSSADLDSDDDGLADALEDANHDGLKGRRETNPARFDTDRDGLPDGLELGRTHGVADPPGPVKGTGHRFRRDRDPRSKTNPLKRDTDHGGTPDGREDKNHNGRVDKGETDPTKTGGKPRRR